MKYVIAYLATAAAFLICDLLWLGFIARDFYRSQYGSLMADPIQMLPAITFYMLFVLGVVIFVVAPALATGQTFDAVLYGFLFGLIAYATYDLTSLAIIKDFPVRAALVDMIWGGVITAISSVTAVFAVQKLL